MIIFGSIRIRGSSDIELGLDSTPIIDRDRLSDHLHVLHCQRLTAVLCLDRPGYGVLTVQELLVQGLTCLHKYLPLNSIGPLEARQ